MRCLLILFLIAGCGPRNWTKTDTALQGAFTASLAADYLQTRQALNTDGIEQNPIMGPEGERVAPEIYFPACAVLHAAGSITLSGRWRTVWQVAATAIQARTIRDNWIAGYAVSF